MPADDATDPAATTTYREIGSVTGELEYTHEVDDLFKGTTYNFKVRASNSFMVSEFSAEVEMMFMSNPSAPSNFREIKTERTETEVTLEWDEPADVAARGGDSQDNILYILKNYIVDTDDLEYEDEQAELDNLVLGETYNFELFIMNSECESEVSELAFTYLQKPGTPNNVEFANDCVSGEGELSWANDDYGYDDETNISYKIYL